MSVIQKRKSKTTGKLRYTAIVRIKSYPTQAATFDKYSEAKEWSNNIEVELKQNKHPNKKQLSNDLTFNELVQRYIKNRLDEKQVYHQKIITHLKWWNKYLSNYKLTDISAATISCYQDKLKKERGVCNSTVNRYTASLSGMFTVATKEWQILTDNPVHSIKKKKEPRGRIRYLTTSEIQRLLEACRQSASLYIYAIVLLALSTGARTSEIKSLRWENIDFDRHLIYFLNTKNDEPRSVPISSKVYTTLNELKEKYGEKGLLFPGKYECKPVNIRNTWLKVLERAGIEDFRFHDLRHTAASYLAMNGATLLELSHILGHKTLQMVKRYAHLTDQHTAELIERMNNKSLRI